jgi:hypothetical protein
MRQINRTKQYYNGTSATNCAGGNPWNAGGAASSWLIVLQDLFLESSGIMDVDGCLENIKGCNSYAYTLCIQFEHIFRPCSPELFSE